MLKIKNTSKICGDVQNKLNLFYLEKQGVDGTDLFFLYVNINLKGSPTLKQVIFNLYKLTRNKKECDNGNARNVFVKEILPHFQKMHQSPF